MCVRTDDRKTAPEQDDTEDETDDVLQNSQDFQLPVKQSLCDVDIYTVYRTDSQESLGETANVLDLEESHFDN